MSDPSGPPDGGPAPGDIRPRRTLEQPPSVRFDRPAGTAAETSPAGRGPLGAGSGTVVGMVALGTVAIIVLHAVLAVTTGLVAIAALVGYLLGQALRSAGTGGGPAAGANRVAGAVVLALAVVAAGAIGSWLAAIPQGNQLGLADYLGQTVGIVLPAQALAAAAGAWLGSR